MSLGGNGEASFSAASVGSGSGSVVLGLAGFGLDVLFTAVGVALVSALGDFASAAAAAGSLLIAFSTCSVFFVLSAILVLLCAKWVHSREPIVVRGLFNPGIWRERGATLGLGNELISCTAQIRIAFPASLVT